MAEALDPPVNDAGSVAGDDDLSALLWLISAGDPLAFQRLYDREAPRLFALALRVTTNETLAVEALHEALIQIWRRSVQFRPEFGTAEGWLVAQVRQRSVELVRRRQRGGIAPDIAAHHAELDAGLARLHASPEQQRMHAALTGLDSKRREILVLAFLNGLSSVELAQKLRLPIGTVKSSTRRSLEQLHAAFEPPA